MLVKIIAQIGTDYKPEIIGSIWRIENLNPSKKYTGWYALKGKCVFIDGPSAFKEACYSRDTLNCDGIKTENLTEEEEAKAIVEVL